MQLTAVVLVALAALLISLAFRASLRVLFSLIGGTLSLVQLLLVGVASGGVRLILLLSRLFRRRL